MQRFHQLVFIGSVLGLSWLLMQVVHEFGHVASAWATGATVSNVVLHPLAISRTDVEPNPRPLIVAWGGPVVGAALPFAFWALTSFARVPGNLLFRFFAGFCLLANGLYLGIGSFSAIGDAGDILRHGSGQWMLLLFGLITAPVGLALWNGIGPTFGMGANSGAISGRLAFGCFGALVVLIIVELTFSGR